ncbi:hypothetical protein [Yersinia phage vB_YenS-P840]|nr:hypothetical protein [Yersinia phage vB_YenS-P840]
MLKIVIRGGLVLNKFILGKILSCYPFSLK